MEIRRTAQIFEEQYKLSKPETTGEFTKHLVKKWFAVDDVIKEIMGKASFGNPNDREKIMKSLSTSQSEGTELTLTDIKNKEKTRGASLVSIN